MENNKKMFDNFVFSHEIISKHEKETYCCQSNNEKFL